jgi:hypothetical protein
MCDQFACLAQCIPMGQIGMCQGNMCVCGGSGFGGFGMGGFGFGGGFPIEGEVPEDLEFVSE